MINDVIVAAQKLLDATNMALDTKNPPLKYTAQWGALADLYKAVDNYMNSSAQAGGVVKQWRARADGVSAPWYDGVAPEMIACETRTLYTTPAALASQEGKAMIDREALEKAMWAYAPHTSGQPDRDRLSAAITAYLTALASQEGAQAAVGTDTFFVGSAVEKVGGDYSLAGEVVSVFFKLSGATRYVVEDDRGVLHVYSAKNLRARKRGNQ